MADAVELLVALLIGAGYLAGFVPFSATPFLLALGWLSFRFRRGSWRAAGLARPESWTRTLSVGVIAGALYQFFATYVMDPLIARVTGVPVDVSSLAGIPHNIFMFGLYLLIIWTLAAFGEELVFRGYLMYRVTEICGGTAPGVVTALIVCNVFFGVLHWYQGATGVVDNVLTGAFLTALVLWQRRNLWVAIVAHGVIDTVGLLLVFFGKFPGL